MDTSRRAFIRGQWNPLYPEAPRARAPAAEIVSLIVQAKPEHLPGLIDRVSAVEGAEVHGHDPKGKLIVVLEAESQSMIGARMMEIDGLPHVLSVAMVFQATDTAPLA
jgi:nitrate reductase NapD